MRGFEPGRRARRCANLGLGHGYGAGEQTRCAQPHRLRWIDETIPALLDRARTLVRWGQAQAHGQKLRIITWADYVPADLVAAFKKETGIEVEVTLSNNEEMISKLRATGGAGYDLAQPSQDRIVGAA